MTVDLDTLLRRAGRRGLLQSGRRYAKRELLEAFGRCGLDLDQAGRAFAWVREAARHPPLPGGVRVLPEGRGRGRRYRFEGLAADEATTGGPTDDALRDRHVKAPDRGSDAVTLDVYFGDNLPILQEFDDASFDLIYIDPPFNTGRVQSRTRIRTVRDPHGDRRGFQGRRYRTVRVGTVAFDDVFDDFIAFMEPRLREAWRLLAPDGSFFLHIDYREVHYCKVLLDQIFGRECFLNEIVWAYDYGGRSKRRWPAKHDQILWYVKDPRSYTFNFDAMERIPYMAPGLVGREKAARGKTPTDVWWHTIVPTHGRERTGYPTQKPLCILNRIVKVHSTPGARVLDFFAGSGTTGEAAVRLGRSCTLIDNSADAMRVMAKRLAFAGPVFHGWG